MINSVLHQKSGAFSRVVDLGDIDSLLKERANSLWIDVQDPSEPDFRILKEEFQFHDLALEDASKLHQRPKIDSYDHFYFVVFYVARINQETDNIALQEVDLFIGENYLVTSHLGPVPELEEASARWQSNTEAVASGIGSLIHAILDTIVDSYFPVTDRVADKIEELEEAIFQRADDKTLQSIFNLKKSLLALRRVVAPERDVLLVLTRRDLPVLDESSTVYFQDVFDHCLRILDSITMYQDLLTSALDAYMSMLSARLNQVMKVLTAVSAILMSVGLITGIYGMNFTHMPELNSPFGYPFALMLILVTGGVLALLFRRIKWL